MVDFLEYNHIDLLEIVQNGYSFLIMLTIRKIQITDVILSVGKTSLPTDFSYKKIYGQFTKRFNPSINIDKFINKKIYRKIIHR